jgi:hypothetical protein
MSVVRERENAAHDEDEDDEATRDQEAEGNVVATEEEEEEDDGFRTYLEERIPIPDEASNARSVNCITHVRNAMSKMESTREVLWRPPLTLYPVAGSAFVNCGHSPGPGSLCRSPIWTQVTSSRTFNLALLPSFVSCGCYCGPPS